MKRTPKRPQTRRYDIAPQVNINRSTFDLSHPVKTTFDSGQLIPLPPIEVLPGDSFRVRMSALTRLATPLHPTMDNLHLESFWFFVPNRLVWDNWQKFMGEQENPGDSTDFIIPRVDPGAGAPFPELGNADYMGLPVGVSSLAGISALPFRALRLIWNEWFRDQNLQNSLTVQKGNGPDNYQTEGYDAPLKRGKRKDYISSALPWPQKGPGTDIPLGSVAPITTTGADGVPVVIDQNGQNVRYLDMQATPGSVRVGSSGVGDINLFADLSSATGATINDWRQAFQIQKLQERDARGGTRYTEILRSHFQVISPDARLQRPEFLGSGYSPVQMNTVPQTSETQVSGNTPQGNLTAYGTATMQNHGFTKSFVEHGWIIGLINVRADLNYQQRIDRMWSRSTKYDFYWPALQALGEQPVYLKEVKAQGGAPDDTVWGYQERWSEYKSRLGVISGKFRSDANASLDPWHYALDFLTPPALNADFVVDAPPVARTIAVSDEPEFILDAWLSIRAARPMPVYSVPGYIDHF